MTTLPATIDRAACERLDAGDPLRAFRDRFLCDDDLVYLDGNSLGRIPRETPRRLATLLGDEWGRGLVRSWTSAGWMESPLRCGDAIAEIIGAGPGEVLVTDSTSVDLFKLAAAVMDARPRRRVLLTEHENFPTDRYIAGGVTELLGAGRMLRSVPRQEISAAIDDDTALLLLTHVDFRTGERFDMRALTDAAHAKGALVLWDLSHSTGAINVDLHAAGADLATGCGYKYLNGGPGAPAYLFVNTPLQSELRNPIRGWLGHESPFTYEPEYRGATGIRQWMSGSPPIIAIASLRVAVDIAREAGMQQLEDKAAQLTELFIRLSDERLAEHGFELATPRDASRRGAQVSLRHPSGYPVVRALIERSVVGDFRDPDICRFGLAPLYTRFVDVWDGVDRLDAVMRSGDFRREEFQSRVPIT